MSGAFHSQHKERGHTDNSWRSIAGTNRVERFHRVPSDLRKYLEYTSKIKAQYGSVMRFVVKERLCWGDGDADDLKPKGRPFEFDGTATSTFLSSRISSGETADPPVPVQRISESYTTTGRMGSPQTSSIWWCGLSLSWRMIQPPTI